MQWYLDLLPICVLKHCRPCLKTVATAFGDPDRRSSIAELRQHQIPANNNGVIKKMLKC